jgi:hypothetical protein
MNTESGDNNGGKICISKYYHDYTIYVQSAEGAEVALRKSSRSRARGVNVGIVLGWVGQVTGCTSRPGQRENSKSWSQEKKPDKDLTGKEEKKKSGNGQEKKEKRKERKGKDNRAMVEKRSEVRKENRTGETGGKVYKEEGREKGKRRQRVENKKNRG